LSGVKLNYSELEKFPPQWSWHQERWSIISKPTPSRSFRHNH
jgi:hypothetical protein